MKNILHIQVNDIYGSPFTIASNIHEELIKNGHQSKILVAKRTTNNVNIIQAYSFHNKLIRKVFKDIYYKILNRKALNRLNVDYNFSFLSVNQLIRKLGNFKPNIIILYWTSHYFNTTLLRKLSKMYNAKVFWIIPDMLPLTGGCHYSYGCSKYFHNCGNCPMIKSTNKNDLSAKTLKHKAKNLNNIDIRIIAPSTEFKYFAENSSLFRDKTVELAIPGVDEKIFNLDFELKEILKRQKGILKNDFVIFIGAVNPDEQRKGFHYFIDALKLLQGNTINDKRIIILTAGKIKPEFEKKFNHIHLGYLKNFEELRDAYRISDVFLNLTIADAGPFMLIESMMTGTPVISFEVGLANDLIVHMKNGLLLKNKSAKDLIEGIEYISKLNELDYKKLCVTAHTVSTERASKVVYLNRINEIILG